MRLTYRDGIATVATAAAVVFYALWVTNTVAPNLSTRVAALVVFASEVMLAILVVAMVALWLAATARHAYGNRPRAGTRSGGSPVDSAVRGPHPTF